MGEQGRGGRSRRGGGRREERGGKLMREGEAETGSEAVFGLE